MVTLMVPPNRRSYEVQIFLNIVVNDDVDEDWQSFALVAEIGRDVPDEVSCFETVTETPFCSGRQGATEIRIIDDDGKFNINIGLSHYCDYCVWFYNSHDHWIH